jgi:23S rRNA (cytidine1920-2'-O)/16S rRNA (cytidine1409-2'-O)-methyltransferase
LSSAARHDSMKHRIDQILVERGIAESRHKAQALLLAGRVLVNGQKVEKPGQQVDAEAEIRVLHQVQFASRAGAKLQGALDHFHISVAGRVCADLGASTGGFTDCLLQKGASRIYAFDVGHGQLDWRLRSDPRIVVRDGFNVRNLGPADLPPDVSFVCMDLSFISVTKVLLPLRDALASLSGGAGEKNQGVPFDVVVLVKPQFEVGRGEVGKGGIVRDPAKRLCALESVSEFSRRSGFIVAGSIPSPVPGAEGNQEFLLYLQLTKGL